MRSTLFYIPHADPWYHLPVFGAGWLLGLLMLISLGVMVWLVRRQGWTRETLGYLPIVIVLGAAILWIGPRLEEVTAAGVPRGVPIRGYGVMLLLGVVSGVGLVAYQAQRSGLDPEVIFSLAFWGFVAGIVGARMFYVIEYWDQFARPTARDTVIEVLRLTEGGLVVYGSFIGAVLATVWFLRRHGLPLLAVADLLPAGMLLGLALGRVGCFLNGCCYGGPCPDCPLGIRFPPGSPPFIHQLENGQLAGMKLQFHPRDNTWIVTEVEPGGLAAQQNLHSGDQIVALEMPRSDELARMRHGEAVEGAVVTYVLHDGRRISWRFQDLPARSQAVYPTQLLSTVNAALICWFLWMYYPVRRRDGEVFALMLTIYPVTRVLLEIIRIDEPSLFASEWKLTISQAVSGILVVIVILLWTYILRQPKGTAFPIAPGSPR